MKKELPTQALRLAWLETGDDFPSVDHAWPNHSSAPGLLASSATLNAGQLLQAYRYGIFPWFSPKQPVLWWSPDPRMVLVPHEFRLHRSLRQSLKQWLLRPGVALVFNRDFEQVIHQCANITRPGQNGTWIMPSIIQAYTDLHQQGLAHSAELWLNDRLLAGLYFVALGHAVFGESMFTTVRDGSKLALSLLISVACHHGVPLIDCQQNTAHLASLGAHEIPRDIFLSSIRQAQQEENIDWGHESLYLNELIC